MHRGGTPGGGGGLRARAVAQLCLHGASPDPDGTALPGHRVRAVLQPRCCATVGRSPNISGLVPSSGEGASAGACQGPEELTVPRMPQAPTRSAGPSSAPTSGERAAAAAGREGSVRLEGPPGPTSKPPARAPLTSRSGWARTRSPADCGSRTRCPSTSSGIAEAAAPARAACRSRPHPRPRAAQPRRAPPRGPPGNRVRPPPRRPKRRRKSGAGTQGAAGNAVRPRRRGHSQLPPQGALGNAVPKA